jgi:hypothetical protein
VDDGEAIDKDPYWSRILLFHNIAEAVRIRNEYDLDYRQVFSFNEWRGTHGKRISADEVEIAVDNLDLLLSDMFGVTPTMIAINGRAKS